MRRLHFAAVWILIAGVLYLEWQDARWWRLVVLSASIAMFCFFVREVVLLLRLISWHNGSPGPRGGGGTALPVFLAFYESLLGRRFVVGRSEA